MEIVTLEGLLNRSTRRTSVADDVDDAMNLLTMYESICILEQNLIVYESAINVELSFDNLASSNIIALEGGFGEGVKNIFEKIKQFFKGIWDFIVKQINKIINFFKGLGKHKKSSKEQETFNTILSTPPDKLEEKLKNNNDSNGTKIEFPPIRKYAIAPEDVIDKLLKDLNTFIPKFDDLCLCTDFSNPSKFDEQQKRMNDIISNTVIFDINCSKSDDTNNLYCFIAHGEWSDGFDKKVFPNGTDKEKISMKDAHITPKTFEYINDNEFLKLLRDIEQEMSKVIHTCVNDIDKAIKSVETNNSHSKDVHTKLKYFRTVFMSALSLTQCVWGKINAIIQEIGTTNKQLDLMAAAFSNA
jgi:hypothetical protein